MSTARNGQSIPQPGSPQPLIDTLRQQIRKLETAGRAGDGRVIPTGCPDLDRQLPDGGLATGTLTEWLTPDRGCGAELLSLVAAREACADGGALVVLDPEQRFHPPAAAAWGISLQNLVVLRVPAGSPASTESLLWAADQALRCPAVAAVWGHLGDIGERWLRRFRLSAEQSGAMGLFVRPLRLKGQPGWSEVQMEIGRAACLPAPRLSAPLANGSRSAGFDRRIRLRLLRVRSGCARQSSPLTLQIDFTTGKMHTFKETHEHLPGNERRNVASHTVRLAAQLAHPATGGRRQRA
jgi:hypothetical protein